MANRVRENRRSRKEARQQKRLLLAGGIVAAVAVVVALVIVLGGSTSAVDATGEEIPIMADASQHVDVGVEVDYSTNPPTSGPHYSSPTPPGFYDEPVADGNLVHSLEHGYVIFWYDCSQLSDDACEALKDDIRGAATGAKRIAVPREGMDTPLALTTWGRLLRLEAFDQQAVNQFVRANIGKAPEPQGQ